MPAVSISIDGPTASGKTTLATSLAEELGLAFLDTGVTYRSLAYALDHVPIDRLRTELGSLLVHQPEVHHRQGKKGICQHHAILFRGEDITQKIWHASLDGNLKSIAQDQACRREILRLHQNIAEKHDDIVAVGRDVAVTLLPHASLHVYLTASETIRRERRRAQYRTHKDRSTSVGPATERDLQNRDAIRAMPNALEVDSTYSPASAVFASALHGLRRHSS
ncbi:(d)CMP kinase [Streptomyces melanogenes]|uniref:(d)CMP kinase n=1 Tax=Streptomyces melanogenes TaxID=67326 RepID=UPI00167C9020|nr:(d)CMP kinase [Streptomyces melanogenes]GGP60705.1 cytidylate kinase [Streptomyces melanogenes]